MGYSNAWLMARARTLSNWNLAAIVIFLVFGIISIGLTIAEGSGTRSVPLTIDTGGVVTVLTSYKLWITELPYVFIAALFHLLALLNVDKYYNRALLRGEQRLRWWEYTITNGLMTLSIAQLAGVTNILLLQALFLANVSMNYGGYVTEQLNAGKKKWTRILPLIIGFAPYIAIWVATLVSNFSPLVTQQSYDAVAVIGSFIFSLLFVVPLLWRYFDNPRNLNETMDANLRTEILYVVLSILAKGFLLLTSSIGDFVD